MNSPQSFDTLFVQQFALRFLFDGAMLCIFAERFFVLSVGGAVECGWGIVVKEDGTGIVGLNLLAVGVCDGFCFEDVRVVVRWYWFEL